MVTDACRCRMISRNDSKQFHDVRNRRDIASDRRIDVSKDCHLVGLDSRSSASSVHFAQEETAVLELVTLADCPLAREKDTDAGAEAHTSNKRRGSLGGPSFLLLLFCSIHLLPQCFFPARIVCHPQK